jgi:hypothetical protein
MFLSLFFSSFFLHLFVKFFSNLLLELFLSHFFQLFLLFKKLSIEFDKCGPFIIIISFHLINWLWSYWTGLWVLWWFWWTYTSIVGFLWNLRRCLASLIIVCISISNVLFRCHWFLFLWNCFFYVKIIMYSSDYSFCTIQQL